MLIKIPVNTYNYTPYVFGISIKNFLVIIIGITLFAVLIKINIYIPFIFLIIYLYIFLGHKTDIWVFYNSFRESINYKTSSINQTNDDGIFLNDKEFISAFELNTGNYYMNLNKNRIMGSFQGLIENIDSELTIISRPVKYADGSYFYKTFLIISSGIIDIIKNDSEFILKNKLIIKNQVYNHEEISRILFLTTERFFKSFLKTNDYFASLLDLHDANYDQDFLYNLLIDSFSFPCIAVLNLKSIKNKDVRLKRMLAERISEFRNKSTRTVNIKDQINSIKNMQDSKKIFDMYMTLIIESEHPVDLKNNTDNTVKHLKSMGLEFKISDHLKYRNYNLRKLYVNGYKYLIGSKCFSSMVPLSFSEYEKSCPAIAINSINNKKFYFNPFNYQSYNMIITGETGSGKTFFTKKILKSLHEYYEMAFIIDPLNEYDDGLIINSSSGEYLNFSVDNYEEKSILALFISTILRDVKYLDILNTLNNIKPGNDIKKILTDINKYYSGSNHSSSLNYYINNYIKIPVNANNKRIIFRYSLDREDLKMLNFIFILAQINNMARSYNGHKLVVIDESHLLLGNPETAETIDNFIRNSRHYGTSIINITQNIDDFFMNIRSHSIFKNSSHVFLFRQKESKNLNKILNIEIKTENLPGGTGLGYSECYYYGNDTLYRLRII
ncbi:MULTISPECIES: ATPase/DNA packaging protein [Acidiplasma]|uniref:AAA+ ATPase domain-containing protein n=2 Tax=Acidiplasma aeolicum TaxID=507754 RepID=A0A0P9CUQ9_9ARCH|nr:MULTISPECIES: ATPase/DNA packaging protein [Acidiplasma]KJE49144.1 hypothetical protein TZ01_03365 [Acidiplasma sp. MBA-1]KPV46692.1 hypothetical protein SE19_04445 [Acidiplasma aeolicum]WMT54921.1 MAG: ATP-binding protein [Acidiplasma sp.]